MTEPESGMRPLGIWDSELEQSVNDEPNRNGKDHDTLASHHRLGCQSTIRRVCRAHTTCSPYEAHFPGASTGLRQAKRSKRRIPAARECRRGTEKQIREKACVLDLVC